MEERNSGLEAASPPATHAASKSERATDACQSMDRAAAAYASGRWSEAERICRLIRRTNADHLVALTLLGIMAARSGRLKEAANLFTRAAVARPQDAATHNNLGNVLKDLG